MESNSQSKLNKFDLDMFKLAALIFIGLCMLSAYAIYCHYDFKKIEVLSRADGANYTCVNIPSTSRKDVE